MKNIVVIGDLVKVKRKKEENIIQSSLQSGLNLVNRSRKSISVPFKIIVGNEFQGVYKNADTLFFDLLTILQSSYPDRVKFSIGIGEITSIIAEDTVVGMDGPAFNSARKDFLTLKKSDSFFKLSVDIIEKKLINQTLLLISGEINNWNENRLKIFVMYNSGYEVSRIASELNLSERAVYKSIKDGAVLTVSEIFSEISKTINRNL